MAYLDEHPPARSQMRCPRRSKPSGVIVVHTAESALDKMGVDSGAENVARYVTRRDTPGSYHELVDSDSHIHVVRWECEAFQDGTGSNPHAMGLSFACRAADWPSMTSTRRDQFISRGAARAVAYARWLNIQYGIVIPARRINRAESERKVPGFISHGERDPKRRTDPGADFPWDRFLAIYAQLMMDDEQEEDDMTPEQDRLLRQAAEDAAEAKRIAQEVFDRQVPEETVREDIILNREIAATVGADVGKVRAAMADPEDDG